MLICAPKLLNLFTKYMEDIGLHMWVALRWTSPTKPKSAFELSWWRVPNQKCRPLPHRASAIRTDITPTHPPIKRREKYIISPGSLSGCATDELPLRRCLHGPPPPAPVLLDRSCWAPLLPILWEACLRHGRPPASKSILHMKGSCHWARPSNILESLALSLLNPPPHTRSSHVVAPQTLTKYLSEHGKNRNWY